MEEKISVIRINSISTHPPKYPDKQPMMIAMIVDTITAVFIVIATMEFVIQLRGRAKKKAEEKEE